MGRFDVYIGGEGYILDPEYGEQAYDEQPQENYKGKDREGPDFWQNWTMRDWHGGERQAVMTKEADIEAAQYHTAEGLKMDTFGEFSLQPALELDLAFPVELGSLTYNACMAVSTDGSRVFLGMAYEPYVKIWYSGTWTSATSVAGTGAVTDIVVCGSTLYGVRGGKVITSTNNGVTWTEVQYQTKQVKEVIITSRGNGFTSAPTVSFEADVGSGAVAAATLTDGYIESITVTNPSTGYTTIPAVTITGGGGSGATAVAVVDETDQTVTSVVVRTAGTGYTSTPTVTIAPPSVGADPATATAKIADKGVLSIAVSAKGSGYVDPPRVIVSGGGGVGATAVATLEDGSAASFSTAVAVTMLNSNLFVGKSSGGVYNQTKKVPVTTTGSVTSMCAYKEDLYWIEDRRLWRYNGQVAFVYDELPSGFNGEMLFPYRQVLLVLGWYREQSGYRGAVYYVASGTENHLYSVGDFSEDNRMYAACGGDDEVWFVNRDRGGVDRYDLTYGGLTCGLCWGPADGISAKVSCWVPFKGIAYADGYFFIARHAAVTLSGTCIFSGSNTTQTHLGTGSSAVDDAYNGLILAFTAGTGVGQYMTVIDYNGATHIATHAAITTSADNDTGFAIVSANDGIWKANLANPTAWRTTGYVESSEWDFEFANDEKILGSIGIYHRALLPDEFFQVYYSLDGGDTYVWVGDSRVTGSTRNVFSFASVRFDSLKVKVIANGPGTSTPKCKKVLVRACALAQAKWMWKMRLLVDRVASRSGRARKGFAALQHLKDTSNEQLPVTFVDRSGGAHSVVIEDCSIAMAANSKRRAFLSVTLREL